MLRTSAVPPGPGAGGFPAAPDVERLDDILRLPPGRQREQEILRVVAGLSASLAAMHEGGRAHGGICPDAVVRDGQGFAVLAPPFDAAPDDEDAARHAGYAAFEQYTDDPGHSCGPWTDVYGLAALAYFLATGAAPPGALARRVRDDCPPLDEWHPGAYRAAFCAAVDEGLAMEAQARPRTAAALAAAMGVIPPAVPAPAAVSVAAPVEDPEPDMTAPSLMMETPAGDLADPPPAAARLTAMRPEHPTRARRMLPLAVAGLLLLAAGGYAWLPPAQPPVELAGVAPPQAQQQPQPQSEPPSQPPPQPLPPSEPQPQPAPAPTPPTPPDSPAAALPASPPQAAATGSTMPSASPKPDSAPEPEAAAAPAASEPAAPATPPPQAAPVTVRVAVRPWGEVVVNGRSRGVSPPLRELSLPPGRYQVTVRNASAGDYRMTLTVAPGRPVSITHEFE
ncbi:hypothetical protein RAS14_05600 [Achromobacter aegrifaciens]|uniref:hypothetical protein n=1 Tax=Achromobacter aegrifaciens TaxID=1287736 RepID=UPI00278F4FC8|nr:hypothetical protein [Achromobacter aegrifaciens]MDQ1759212.1 hypothetical protein [Achromobacter aegrifaciens]